MNRLVDWVGFVGDNFVQRNYTYTTICELRKNPRGNSVKQGVKRHFTAPPVLLPLFMDKGRVTLPHSRQIRIELAGPKTPGVDIMLEQRSNTACRTWFSNKNGWRMEPADRHATIKS